MSLAGAGEVFVSHASHDLVVDRLPETFTLKDLGEREIRGMTRPERVFALENAVLPSDRPASRPARVAPEKESKRAAWVAVLPFLNIGNDPEQEYFADGVAEDIISGLARWRSLRIVSRSSSFQFRGEDMSTSAIAAALGVEYIIEGSVRRAGNRIRVTASLIEVSDEHTVWTSRYDLELDDIFTVQDEIAMNIVNAINPAIIASAATNATRVRPGDLDAWDHVQRGQAELLRFRREPNGRAREYFLAAVEIDPEYAAAYSGLAWTYAMGAWLNWEPDYDEASDLAHEYANRAIELDPTDPDAYAARAMANYTLGRLDAVRRDADRAITLNPSHASAYLLAAAGRIHGGNAEEGLALMRQGLELSPRDPAVAWFHGMIAVGEFVAGSPEKTIGAARTAIAARYGYLFGRVLLVASLAETGDLDEARNELATMLEVHPGFTLDLLNPYTFADAADRRRIVDGLRAAGFED
jgi:TolB-like protein